MLTLLLVEDNHTLRTALKRGLEATGKIQVRHHCASGEEALTFCLEEAPAVILLDVQLAGALNGIQSAIAIRRERPRMPVVFYSIQDDDAYYRDFRKSGILSHYAYVRKSNYLLPPMIVPLLHDALAGRSFIDPEIAARVQEVGQRDANDPMALLEPNERLVARLIAQGLTNEQIAARLGFRDKRTISRVNGQIYTAWGLDATTSAEKTARTRAAIIVHAGRLIHWDKEGAAHVQDARERWVAWGRVLTGNLLFDWTILAISLTNVILLLWLGLTVLLNAKLYTGGVWLVGGGLLLGSLFFMAHTAIVAVALDFTDTRLNFWWRAGWMPLVALPYVWYAIVLWYSNAWSVAHTHPPNGVPRHRYGFAAATLLFVTLMLLLGFTRLLPTFPQVLALDFSSALTLAGIPILLLLYPVYIVFCMALALWALLCPPPLSDSQQHEARRRAHPWLIATTLDLLLVSLLVAALIAWIFGLARPPDQWSGVNPPSIPGFGTLAGATAGNGPLHLTVAWFDLAIAGLLVVATVLIGQAIVSYEVFSGRVLPRAALHRHWRNALYLAVGYSGLVSGSLILALPPVYLVLSTASLITLFYALLGWRTFQRHDELMRQLRPFVRSQHLYEQVVATTPLDDETNYTFQALCNGVLKTDYAVLAALGSLAPLLQPPWVSPRGAPLPNNLTTLAQLFTTPALLSLAIKPDVAHPARYAVPLWSERGLIGLLLLGRRRDGGLYTQEELEVAQAIGERLIDTRASSEIARRLFSLQRQRLAESQLMDRQTRRTLHDDILPELHTALLTLSQGQAALGVVQGQLSALHRQISTLLRSQQPASPHLLDQGLLPALQRLLDEEMRGMFTRVGYHSDEAAQTIATSLRSVEREILYYAVREAVRNAARHGRGANEQRPLHLQLTLVAHPSGKGLVICVEDDGAGIVEPDRLEQGGGLILHRTLLAILGATFEVTGKVEGGVLVRIIYLYQKLGTGVV